MSSWCKNALQDPNVKVLVQNLFEQPCKQISQNTTRINSLEEKCERYETDIQMLKQDKLAASLRIFNPKWTETTTEDIYQLVEDFICDDLEMSEFEKSFISSARRVGKKKTDGTPRPVVCFFLSERVCQKVYSKCKSLPEGCSMNENLIGPLANLAYCARQLKRSQDIAETWVRHGKIYVKAHEEDRAQIVNTPVELLGLVKPPVLDQTFTWQFAKDNYKEMDPMIYVDMVRSGHVATGVTENSKSSETYKFIANGNKRSTTGKPKTPAVSVPNFQFSVAGLADALKSTSTKSPAASCGSAAPTTAPPAAQPGLSSAPATTPASAAPSSSSQPLSTTVASSTAPGASGTAAVALVTDSSSKTSVAHVTPSSPVEKNDKKKDKKKDKKDKKEAAKTNTTSACDTPIVSANHYSSLAVTLKDGSDTEGSDSDIDMLQGRLNSLRDNS